MDEKDLLIQKLMHGIAALEKLVEQQVAVIITQPAKITELEKRLNKNSSNSSKPPSSDGISKLPKTNSLRQKGKNKSGGQPGHQGDTLRQVQTSDKIVCHKLLQCPLFSTSLMSAEILKIVKRHHWKLCYQLPDRLHALCNQHHLRELKALIEYDKEPWVRKMRRFLQFSLRYRHAYEDQSIPNDKLNRFINFYNTIVNEGIFYHEHLSTFSEKKARDRKARRTGHNLILRFKNHRHDVSRLLVNPRVPFINSQAERNIRKMKCKQKTSGGFRSVKGTEIFARICGFISTTRKQGGIFSNQLSKLLAVSA